MSKKNILVVGSGGREHALIWKLAQSPQAGTIYAAPGNAGTAALAENVAIAVEDFDALVEFAQEKAIALTVVGPEVPLAAGIADRFQAVGLRVFGPNAAAAQIESSKAFAKDFMQRYNIPTAAYASFTDYDKARAYLDSVGVPVVVKADGLAAGKGVIICQTLDEAQDGLKRIMQDRDFGAAGGTVVIEECLNGPEVSVLAFCDGKTAVTMPSARDHKRAYEGDAGPNTGGMGAFTPPPDVDAALVERIARKAITPVLQNLRAEGKPYVGVLYAGLMLTDDGPKVLEYNCRFGDPETQVILPLLESDLVAIMDACIDGQLDQVPVQWQDAACATVVMASPGYPGSYPKGLPISGADITGDDALVFHAGTALKDGVLVTSGGRVLAVSAVGDDLAAALDRAYTRIDQITFEGAHFRRDIGKNARS